MVTHDPDFDLPKKTAKIGRCLDSEAAFSSHVWGVIAIFCWWVPLLGQVAVAAGLVRGCQGWFSPHRLHARIGVVLSLIALVVMIFIFICVVKATSRATNL